MLYNTTNTMIAPNRHREQNNNLNPDERVGNAKRAMARIIYIR